jgi:hypothetical protein
VKSKITTLLLIATLTQNAFPADLKNMAENEINNYIKKEVLPFMSSTQKNVKKYVSSVNKCYIVADEFGANCPPYIMNLIEDNYSGGLFGIINKATSNGSVATPDTICGNTQLKITPVDFIKQLNSSPYARKVPPYLLSASMACVNDLGAKYSSSELSRARQYALSSMVYLPQQLEAGYKNMLESKSQLDLMLGNSTQENCSNYPTSDLINLCRSMEECKHPKNDAYFDSKAMELTDAFKNIQKLNGEIKRLKLNRNENIEAITRAEIGIKAIKELYPMISSSPLSGMLNRTFLERPIELHEVKAGLRNELINTRKKVISQLSELKIAGKCISGETSQCSGLSRLLKLTSPGWKPRYDLPFENYYSCIDKTKSDRDIANKDLNEAAISVALVLTPFLVVRAAGMVYKTGSLIKSAATVAKVNKVAIVGSTAADVTLTEIEASKIYSACKSKLEVLEEYQNKAPTCEIQEKKVALTTDLSSCHQQILTGALSVAFSGLGLGLAVKSAQDISKVMPENVLKLVNKESDKELKQVLDQYITKLKNPDARKKAIIELSTRLKKISNMKDHYSPEEIRTAVKVYLKKCAN